MRLPRGSWVKAQLHAHSTNSDGRLSPEKVLEFYCRAGFGVVAITDHNRVTRASRPDVVAVPGIEVAAREEGVDGELHVVLIGAEEAPPRGSAEGVLRWGRERGLYAFVAHPYWSMLSGSDLLRVASSFGVEVYNHGCEVEISRGYSGPHWDYALSKGLLLHGLAVDDAHAYSVDALGGWVVLDLTEADEGEVLRALREGRFYASSGVAVEALEIGEGRLWLRCSGARVVKVLSGGTRGAYLSPGLIERLARSEGLPIEVEAWEGGFRLRGAGLRVEGRLDGGRIVELEAVGQLPLRGFARVELVDGERAAWLNPVKVGG